MSEELVKYETHKTNSLTDIVQIGAWSGAPEGGYQFTFQIDWEKWEDYKGGIASHEKHTPKDAWHIMNSLVWFSLSGKQIEDLYLMAVSKEDFKDYLEVQKSGMYNMMSPDAIMASGLDRNVYMEILSNYSELKEKFD